MPLNKKSLKRSTPAKKDEAPEVVESKKTSPSTDNANPPAKTEGQRMPDVVNDEVAG